MSIESTHDPRTALVRTKYFSLHPKPLERWLWQQGLPQAAERVFWLHWEEGMRSGDWCSEIPIKRVARECCVDPSTVTRAYQALKARGLIRREDPGRDPNNPFQQATAITEVRLPRELLIELARSPNRATAKVSSSELLSPPAPETRGAASGQPNPPPAGPQTPTPNRVGREESRAMWARASANERTRFFTASRDRLTHMDFDTGTALTPEDRGAILAQLAQLAIARPDAPRTAALPKPPITGRRRLSTLELARLRRSITDAVPADTVPELLRQVLWSVEEGALHRFALPLAVNIALKKIREGAWSKPNRLPPQWMPQAARSRAVVEQCSAA
jgi:hypothetical protein